MAEPAEVIFHQLAAGEFEDAKVWYASKASEQIAGGFSDEVDRCVSVIADSRSVYEGHHRWLKLRKYP